MRICLFWNETAGVGVSAASLAQLITAAGHRVDHVVNDVAALGERLDRGIDCVVAAGGDGTVAKAGRVLAGGDVPLAILPLGTANNIAASLAIEGTPAELVAKWSPGRVVRIDVGVVQDSSGSSYFLEGVGTGLIAAGITAGRATIQADAAPAEQLQHARRLYLEQAAALVPRPLTLTIDGHESRDRYLSIEILNTPSVGPGIRLSPDVNAADGYLSVIAVGEADRPVLVSYLQAREAGHAGDAGLKALRAERIELGGALEIHVDDKVRTLAGERIAIGVKPAFLPVLA